MIKYDSIRLLGGLFCFFVAPVFGETVSCSSWADVKSALGAGNSVTMAKDIVGDSGFGDMRGKTATLDLNGHTLSCSTEFAEMYLIRLWEGSKLTIEDTSPSGNGAIVGAVTKCDYGTKAISVESSELVINGGAVSNFTMTSTFEINRSRVTVNGGTIANCGSTGSGTFRIYNPGSSFVMRGGYVRNCWSNVYGGFVSASQTSDEIVIEGGTFENCTAGYGGVICAYEVKSVTISGGVFRQNSADYNYGKVLYARSPAVVTIGGGNFVENDDPFYDAGGATYKVRGGLYAKWTDRLGGFIESGFTHAKVGSYELVGKDIGATDGVLRKGKFAFNPKAEDYSGDLSVYPLSRLEEVDDQWVLTDITTPCSTWAELKKALSAGTSAALTADINADGNTIVIPAGNTPTLDLYGHKISRTSTWATRSLFSIAGELMLCDTSTSGAGALDGKGIDGASAFSLAGGTLVLKAGSFKNFSADSGSVLSVTNGTATVDGGVFIDNADPFERGGDGVLALRGGVFPDWTESMDPLVASGFMQVAVGGNHLVGKSVVASSAAVRLGSFLFNPSAKPYSSYLPIASGSRVEEADGLWKVTDGVSAPCSLWSELKTALAGGSNVVLATDIVADSGSAEIKSGKTVSLDLNGFTISRSAAQAANSLVNVAGNLTISDSSASRTGALDGRVLSGASALSLTDGTLALNGGTFTNFSASAGSVLSVTKGTATVNGGVFFNSANSFSKGGSGAISLRGGVFSTWASGMDSFLASGFMSASVGSCEIVGKNILTKDGGLRNGLFTFDPSSAPYAGYVPLAAGSWVEKDGDLWKVTEGSFVCSSWAELNAAVLAGGKVLLYADITADSGTASNGTTDVTLDLYGHKLTRSSSARGERMFVIKGSALKVCDSVGGGKIVGPKSTSGTRVTPVLVSEGGTFELNGGTITYFYSSENGGVIRSSAATGKVLISGGEITDCSSDDSGGALYLHDCQFAMTGGFIHHCSATNYGGALYLSSTDSEATIKGGAIENCRAVSWYGGAIYCVDVSNKCSIYDLVCRNNQAQYGGAIYLSNGSVEVYGGLFSGNLASYSGANDFYFKYGTFAVAGGVFEVWPEACSLVSGYEHQTVNGKCVVGKSMEIKDAKIRSGEFTFDLSKSYYASLNLIYPTSSVVQDGSVWRVANSTVDEIATSITSSTAPGTLLQTGYYEVTNNVTLNGGAGTNGLTVAEGATVSIYVKPGVTLELTGGAGSGRIAGGAGIAVPESSTLIFVGKGKVKATGGASGRATAGGDGGDAEFKENDNPNLAPTTNISGEGGKGGDGGGGAGAGIGGRGGDGGAGGAGGIKLSCNGEKYPRGKGNDGKNGGDGTVGGGMGEVYVLGSLSVTPKCGRIYEGGGAAGAQGERVNAGRRIDGSVWYYYGTGGGGSGGGGGSMTNEATAVGHGGGGGGGVDYQTEERNACGPTGQGGFGGDRDGKRGSPTDKWHSKEAGNVDGGGGGTGGKAGGTGGDGKLYLSHNSTISDGQVADVRDTHEFLHRQVKFDLAGGNVKGSTEVLTRDAYLYMEPPSVSMPDKAGNLFLGYFTAPTGGRQCYDSTGAAVDEYWKLDSSVVVLYAQWRECTPPANALVVTTLNDEEFNPDATVITLRAAITWAMLFPGLTGEDGTPSKVTFAPALWQDLDAVEVLLTCGEININEGRFTDHPLIVAGPGLAECTVAVDGLGFDRVLKLGAENKVEVEGLEFRNGYTLDDGGAILTYATSLKLTDCIFTGNRSEVYGGAVASTGEVSICRCRFESNRAVAKDGGAIFSQSGGMVTIKDSSFKLNDAVNGGALSGFGDYFVLNSTFVQNSASGFGGGYYLGAGAGTSGANQFVNCTFRSNSADLGGGGIATADAGALTLMNVLVVQNSSSDYSGTGDILSGGATITAKGVLAQYSNLTGGEDCTFGSSIKSRDVYKSTSYGKTKVLVGESWQYVEMLKASTQNKALTGYDGSPWRTDITGRNYDTCQMGSYWSHLDEPGLVVQTLEDVVDEEDGYLSLREIVMRISNGVSGYTALAKDGVYPITFTDTLAGVLALTTSQMDVRNLGGKMIEIDGGNRVTIRGYCVDDSGATSKTNGPHRAFTVWNTGALRLKRLKFQENIGKPYSLTATETRDGGAISNRGKLEAENCSFTRCATGDTYLNPTARGGAIANGQGTTGASATLKNCSFTECRAMMGGAVYNYGGNSLDLAGCTFSSNRAGGGAEVVVANGGAIFNEMDGTLSYVDTTFTGNSAVLDGKSVASDVGGKDVAEPHFAVSVAGGKLKVALSSAAAPELSGGEAAIDLTSSADEVTVMPENVKPFLYYGLGRADTPGGGYTVESWVQADANGRLPHALAAPKAGVSGFYKVMVKMGE